MSVAEDVVAYAERVTLQLKLYSIAGSTFVSREWSHMSVARMMLMMVRLTNLYSSLWSPCKQVGSQ